MRREAEGQVTAEFQVSSPEAGCAIGRAQAQKVCVRTQWSMNSSQLICSRPASIYPPDLGPEGGINWQWGLSYELQLFAAPRPHLHVKGPHVTRQQQTLLF